MTRTRAHRARGILLLDGVYALAATGVILATLAVAAGQFRAGLRRMDQHEAAARQAQTLAAMLRQGIREPALQAAASEAGFALTLRQLDAPPPLRWVELRVERDGVGATLIAAAGEAKP